MGDLDSLYINLSACLVSCKGGIPLKDVESELLLLLYFFVLKLFCKIILYIWNIRIDLNLDYNIPKYC